MSKPEMKAEALRLRTIEHKSYKEIEKTLGVSRGSLSLWLRDSPLTDGERTSRKEAARVALSVPRGPYKSRGDQSRYHLLAGDNAYSPNQKGTIAEMAVRFRLVILGYDILLPMEGSKLDLVVQGKDSGSFYKVQIKWAATQPFGLPSASLRCANGRHRTRTYREGEFDILVTYDLYSDSAYVFTFEEVRGLTGVAVRPDALERWDKIK